MEKKFIDFSKEALIIYYSYGGNTREIARMISEKQSIPCEEILTVLPYKGTYDEVVAQGKKGVNNHFLTEIQPISADVSAYSFIFLGTPVWWYTSAPAMKTFLSQTDFTGKKVYPFATHGGWLGNTFTDFAKECKNGQVQPGIDLRFDGKVLQTPPLKITKWLDRIMSNLEESMK